MLQPTSFEFDQYFPNGEGEEMYSILRASLASRLWRRDPADRIVGGMRMALVVNPANPLERLVLNGPSKVRRIALACSDVANVIMSKEVGVEDWKANRVAINFMPPFSALPEHVDPEPFRDGVVVFGFGRCLFT